MNDHVDEEQVYQKWLDLIASMDLGPIIREKIDTLSPIGVEGKHDRSIEIEFKDLALVEGLQDIVINNPEMAFRVGEAAIRSCQEPDQQSILNLRVGNLYSTYERRVRDLLAEDRNRLITMEVEVKKIRENKPRALSVTFQCCTCHFRQEIHQDFFYEISPITCSKDEGGCGKNMGSTRFKKVKGKEVLVDQQKILITEKRESLYGNQQPRDLVAYVEDDLVNRLEGGEVVRVTGIPLMREVKEQNITTSTNTIFFLVNHIDLKNVKGYKIEYTEEEIKTIIEKLGSNPLETMAESFCPFIKGMFRLKQVLLLQQVRGSEKILSGGKKRRKDIHVLLIGDPGTAKSDLAEEACSLIPGSVKVDGSGDNTTPAGLTAVAVRDDFGDGKFTLDSGASVLAHRRNLFIDECHLMKHECFGALRRPMETQTVDVAKGGLQRSLKTEFSGIFVANPKHGKFKPVVDDVPVIEQIDLTKFDAPWRDRIDYFGVVYNQPDVERDKEICKHIMADEHGGVVPDITKDEIIKYLAYCRDNFNPKIPESMKDIVADKYAYYKCGYDGMGSRNDYYTRHLFSTFRFAEAHAKLNRRNECNAEDVEIGFAVVQESLVSLTAGSDGIPDPEAFVSGMGKRTKAQLHRILDLIDQRFLEGKGCNYYEIAKELESMGVKKPEKYLSMMLDKGMVNKDKYDQLSRG